MAAYLVGTMAALWVASWVGVMAVMTAFPMADPLDGAMAETTVDTMETRKAERMGDDWVWTSVALLDDGKVGTLAELMAFSMVALLEV